MVELLNGLILNGLILNGTYSGKTTPPQPSKKMDRVERRHLSIHPASVWSLPQAEIREEAGGFRISFATIAA